MNFIPGPLVLLSAFAFVFAQGAMQPPPGSILPVNQTVLNGTSVTFECKFPNVTYVLWAFNNRVLRHDMYGSNLHTPFKLIFAKVDYRVHVGSYQCFHYNNSVKIYQSPMVYLDIQYMERDFQQQPEDIRAKTGNTVRFNCVGPDSYPPITDVFWYKKLSNTVVQVSNSSRVQPNGTELVLMDVVQTDGGSYYCNVTNGVFWRKSEDGLLLVNPLKPKVKLVNVTASKKKIYVLPDDSVLLECTVYFTSNLNQVLNSSFVWTYNGNQIPAGERHYVYPNGSLLLRDAREDIAGDYICTGRLVGHDDAGDAEDTIHVAIAKIPGPPTVDPPADTIGRGRDVNFTCNPPTRAEPPPSLLWLRNGVQLTSISSPASRSGLKLSLKSLTLSDEGNYTCQAENLAGRKSSVAWLTVEEYPNVSVTTEPAREGGETKLTCKSTSAHATDFVWYHRGSQINASEKYLFSENGEILAIRDISSADLGHYTCTVRDIIHVPRSGAADLTFTDQLYLKRQPANVTKIVNETVTFTCEFRYHSNDSWTVVWFHGNPELTPNSRISFSNKTNGDHSLTVSRISVRDHGMYTCKAVPNNTRTNMGMDEVIGSFFLTAVVPISVEQKPPVEVKKKVGEKLRIDCKAHGHPPPLIEWKSVSSHTGNFVDLKNGSLVFSSLKLNDSGQYTCTVFPAVNNGAAPLTYNTRVVVYTPEQGGISLPRDTIVIIVVGLIAILLYLVVFIICLCVCAQCYRNSLRKKKLELVAMEADMMRTNRKLTESKDNSAILREVGTPMLSTGPVHPPSNMYTIPQTPSPTGTRRMETSLMDGFTSYTTGIRSPLPPVPTVVSDGTELPNFSRGNLKLGDRLGEGEFGPVLLGQAFGLTNNNMPVDVAIKVWLHPRDEDEETADNDLMNFYSQMRLQFDNIASIVGMCTDVEPYYIIYEYLDRGDLKQFLLECRPDEMDVPPLTQENLLHITKQVANGMAYLSSQLIIHGDLAARNCLISSDLRVKVADLGIGHDVYRDDYYDNGEQLLPVRWMPPEILNVPEFTLHSDIWSFGVFCWEVFAFGRLPYDDITDEEVLRLVPQGLRPEVPEEGCPLALYSLMRDCWSPQPEARPKFTQLVVAIIDLNLD